MWALNGTPGVGSRVHVVSQLLEGKSKAEGFLFIFCFLFLFVFLRSISAKTAKLFLARCWWHLVASGPSPSLMEGMISSNSLVGRPNKSQCFRYPTYKAFADLLDLWTFSQTESHYHSVIPSIQSRSSDGRSLWRRRDAIMAVTSECHKAPKPWWLLRPATILEVVPGEFYASLCGIPVRLFFGGSTVFSPTFIALTPQICWVKFSFRFLLPGFVES